MSFLTHVPRHLGTVAVPVVLVEALRCLHSSWFAVFMLWMGVVYLTVLLDLPAGSGLMVSVRFRSWIGRVLDDEY
jgi:hypothetical protein